MNDEEWSKNRKTKNMDDDDFELLNHDRNERTREQLRLTKMRNRLRDLLKTPQGDWYEGKLTRHDHFDTLVHIDEALNRVLAEFTDEDQCRFMASCFRHFLTMHWEMKFSGGVIRWLLLRELHHNGPTDEMQFMLGNHSVRFSKV
ncbi:hypothetical protein Ddye_017221 [Dipteronia dyeriana]|uniref:Uncharacterized protein n=1 Tax=Dipteronia dyeriana TaxID=168575 RepID=A0AAD9U8A9_9ROSI|nr:hypothetical protein Ddye_017221 [Dipteronia dyeriana]